METKLEILKSSMLDGHLEKLINSAREFYLNEDHGLNLTDLEYDALLDEAKSIDPEFDIFDHVAQVGTTVKHKGEFPRGFKSKISSLSDILIPCEDTGLPLDTKIQHADIIVVSYIGSIRQSVLIYSKAPDGIISKIYSRVLNESNIFPKRLPEVFNVKLAFKMISGRYVYLGIMDCPIKSPNTTDEVVRRSLIKHSTEHLINIDLYSEKRQQTTFDVYASDISIEDERYAINYKCMPISNKSLLTPKLDGCSVVAYYDSNCDLEYIASRSNDVNGKFKTSYFDKLIPNHLSIPREWIGERGFMVMMEHVIDLNHGFSWNSRQKANGLTNSKYLLHEVLRYSTFIVYDMRQVGNVTNKRIPLSVVDLYGNNNVPYTYRILDLLMLDDLFTDFTSNYPSTAVDDNSLSSVRKVLFGNGNLDSVRIYKYNGEILGKPLEKEMQDALEFPDWSCGSVGYNKNALKNNIYEVTYYGSLGSSLISVVKTKLMDSEDESDADYYVLVDGNSLQPRFLLNSSRTVEDVRELFDPTNHAHHIRLDLNPSYITGYHPTFLADGVVFESEDEREVPTHTIYKYDYNESAISTVEEIQWDRSQYGTFIPTIKIKPVVVEGTTITNIGVGGYPLLVKRGLGVGAKVQVVRINSTIPQVIKTVERAEVRMPRCPHCNSDVEVLAGMVKCSHILCEARIKDVSWFLDTEYTEEELTGELETIIVRLTPIERYSKAKKRISNEEKNLIVDSIKSDKFELFSELVARYIYVDMTDLNRLGFDYLIRSTYRFIKDKYEKLK